MISIYFKKIYKRYFFHNQLHQRLRIILEWFVSIYGKLLHFNFPSDYKRDQKINMLLSLYERETVVIFKKIIKPGMNIIDAGAHVGYYTRLFSKLSGVRGRVFAFEANEKNFLLLKENIKNCNNVEVFQVALTDHVGPVDFFESIKKSGSHSLVKGAVFEQKQVLVDGSTLDEVLFFKKGRNLKIDIMKIDIEGGEPLAISGMINLLKNNPELIIITELSFKRLNLSKFTPVDYLKMLSSFGFRFFIIKSKLLFPIDPLSLGVDEQFRFLDPINVLCIKEGSSQWRQIDDLLGENV